MRGRSDGAGGPDPTAGAYRFQIIGRQLWGHSSDGNILPRAEPVSISAWRDPRIPLKKCPEERDILVAHRVADLLHAAMVAF